MSEYSNILKNDLITESSIWNDAVRIKEQWPLIHNITNYVVMEFNANVLLALGASPVMAHAPEEVEEMCSIANSLVVNIGTLSKTWVESMDKAFNIACKQKIPTVLDPVAAGVTKYRTGVAKNFIDRWPPSVIRGNASEISALCSAVSQPITKGVDSILNSEAVIDDAKVLSQKTGSVVVISGKVDYIVYEDDVIGIFNGCNLMSKVVGMGCAATATIGAFLSINKSAFQAAAHAMAFFGIAGEIAFEKSKMPGSYKMHFIDILYSMKNFDIEKYFKGGKVL